MTKRWQNVRSVDPRHSTEEQRSWLVGRERGCLYRWLVGSLVSWLAAPLVGKAPGATEPRRQFS